MGCSGEAPLGSIEKNAVKKLELLELLASEKPQIFLVVLSILSGILPIEVIKS
jgi:hypothetical protein